MPGFVALKRGEFLPEAYGKFEMDRLAIVQLDLEQALLSDHFGAFERILQTPLRGAYSVKIRSFLYSHFAFRPPSSDKW